MKGTTMHHRFTLLAALVLSAATAAPAAAATTCNGLPVTHPGTDGPDTIVGTSGPDVIAAGGGNDRVSAGGGDDVICLGPGNDALNGGPGDDLLVAEATADGIDSFAGGAGTDTVRYTARTTAIAVSLDNEADDGASGERDNIHVDVENVFGGSGPNTLRGNAADNYLAGGRDRDVILAGAGDDLLRGGAGPDQLVPGLGDDVVTGGDGDDRITAEAVVDGADTFFGGAGHDIVSYAGRSLGIRVFLDRAANDGEGPFGEGDNIGADGGVEHVIGGRGDDAFNARAFFGGAWFEGRSGADGFTTRNGALDTNDGGLGEDICLGDPIDIRINCER